MLVLALDTSAHLCSACILDVETGTVRGRAVEDIGRGHAERLMAVIGQALDQAEIQFSDIGRIGVTIGPGSFTGIRVGVATARGLALTLKVPAIGVTTLEAIAAGALREAAFERPVLALIDAKRGELYGQVFAAFGRPITKPQAMTPQQAAYCAMLHNAVTIGSGAPAIATIMSDREPPLATPSAPAIDDVARLAATREPGEKPAPLYLRSPDAKPQAGFALARQA